MKKLVTYRILKYESAGKILVSIDRLKMSSRESEIRSKHSLRSLAETVLSPVAFLVHKTRTARDRLIDKFINISMSSIFLDSFGPISSKNLLKPSAISVGPVNF